MNEAARKPSIGTKLAWALVLVLVAAMITLGVTRKRRPVVESPKEKPVPVRVLRVRAAEEVEAITFPGRVEARVDAVLAAE
jgi:hypothetical protein